jgi:hypothetical protein
MILKKRKSYATPFTLGLTTQATLVRNKRMNYPIGYENKEISGQLWLKPATFQIGNLCSVTVPCQLPHTKYIFICRNVEIFQRTKF